MKSSRAKKFLSLVLAVVMVLAPCRLRQQDQ